MRLQFKNNQRAAHQTWLLTESLGKTEPTKTVNVLAKKP